MGWLILLFIVAYFIGSFPTAVIVSKVFFGFDIRTRGSGNMGSTNTFRELGTFWGLLVQIVDILKGLIPVAIFVPLFCKNVDYQTLGYFGGIIGIKFLVGICAIAGHVWSIFVGFKGGKGINTALGMLLGIAPIELFIAILIFAFTFLSSGYVSLGSLVATLSFSIIILIRHIILKYEYDSFIILIVFSVVLFMLVAFTHRQNIKRLLKGTENKFEKFHLIKFKK
jgi:glycerol-3-phosphate acyltransferase PlsY